MLKAFGSGLWTGYIPFASGTWGSLMALGIYWLIPGFEKPEVIIPAILVVIALGIPVGTWFEKLYGKDPAECTIDEVAGMWISLLFLPKTLIWSVAAFLLWRAFDIIKPFGGKKLETLPGGWGIMLDDVVLGVYTMGVMNMFLVLSS
ncbi:MAG: phosphatidylglycerophosphatase A [Ignavibacteriales bacterium]|nr:MAG: phosphatidylglycerophosphatase A [Ignavibacteriales bacterium]